MKFEGIPPGAVDFYRRLASDNTKTFWTAHRDEYVAQVRTPMESLCEELAPEFGTFHLFRPHRDVRFSKDKAPYKDHQGAVTEGEGGEAYYLHIGADGLFVASGYYRMARDQLERYRGAVDDDAAGDALVSLVARLERRYEIGGRELKTAPRGYPRDHPRVRLLQHKGLTVARSLGTPTWLATKGARRRVAEVWRGAAPLYEWLAAYVGPSELPPEEWG